MGITLDDVRFAAQAGFALKLLGRYVRTGADRIAAYVAPHLVSKDDAISVVNDVYNGIVVRGNAVEDVMFYGKGAGKFPTASAVVADVIDAARHIDKTKNVHLWDAVISSILRVLRRWYVVRTADY